MTDEQFARATVCAGAGLVMGVILNAFLCPPSCPRLKFPPMDRPVSTNKELVCEPVRGEDGRFLPGTVAPGRRKGSVSGRAAALKTLDSMLGDERNQENLRHALQASFDNDPVRFFKQIIMPLLPTEVKMKLGADEEGGLPPPAATFNIQQFNVQRSRLSRSS